MLAMMFSDMLAIMIFPNARNHTIPKCWQLSFCEMLAIIVSTMPKLMIFKMLAITTFRNAGYQKFRNPGYNYWPPTPGGL